MKGILWAATRLNITSRYSQTPSAQHLTLQYGVDKEDCLLWLDKEFTAQTLYEAWNGSTQAITVELPSEISPLCANQHPHITISWAEGMKPYEANLMLVTKFTYRLLNKNINFKIEFLEWSVN